MTEVAKCIEWFIKASRVCFFLGLTMAETIRGKDVHAGKYPDRECSDALRVGPGLIDIDRLVLVALDNVSKGSWQPRIGLLPLKPVQAPPYD